MLAVRWSGGVWRPGRTEERLGRAVRWVRSGGYSCTEGDSGALVREEEVGERVPRGLLLQTQCGQRLSIPD